MILKLKIPVLILTLFATLSASCQQNGSNSKSVNSANSSNKKDIRTAKADVKIEKIKLPANFKIDVWAADVPNARSMAISEDGIVFVGNRQGKNVFALVDENGDGKADSKYILA